jgi:hypothetical protein
MEIAANTDSTILIFKPPVYLCVFFIIYTTQFLFRKALEDYFLLEKNFIL